MADETEADQEALSPEEAGEGEPGRTGLGRIDLEAVRQLLRLMDEHDVAELEIEQEDLAVRLRKSGAAPAAGTAMPVLAPAAPAMPAVPVAPAAAAAAPAAEKLPTINSPMVGTFYEATSPDAPLLVKVGDHVTEDTVVCIIEAMKVFNEIRAETRGTIARVLAKNAQAVEYGQPLFAIRPD